MKAGGRVANVAAGVLLALVGIWAAYLAARLPFGSVHQPDAGFFPLSVAVMLVLFALAVSLPRLNGDADDQPVAPPSFATLAMTLGLVGYALALKSIGFPLCTAVLIVAMLRLYGSVRWAVALPGAMAATLACYFLFTRLGVPLPSGITPI